jgi:hypothetical protein
MPALQNIPEWFGAAVLGAVIALLSFVAKALYELWLRIRAEKASRLASILQLASLLRASWVVYRVQNGHARRLLASLANRHPEVTNNAELGFEQIFSTLHDQFTSHEAELHSLIRSMTETSLKPINMAMLDWLKKDTVFRTAFLPATNQKNRLLAEKLYELESHLLLWEAKYNAWIPENPRHALVYLADEEAHGIGFPKGIDKLIQEVILDLSKSAPRIPLQASETPAKAQSAA